MPLALETLERVKATRAIHATKQFKASASNCSKPGSPQPEKYTVSLPVPRAAPHLQQELQNATTLSCSLALSLSLSLSLSLLAVYVCVRACNILFHICMCMHMNRYLYMYEYIDRRDVHVQNTYV